MHGTPTNRPARRRRSTARPPRFRVRAWFIVLVAMACLALALAAGFGFLVSRIGVAPRMLAPYLERRMEGHGGWLSDLGRRMAQQMMWLDRGVPQAPLPNAWHIGAQAQAPVTSPAAAAQAVSVASAEQLVQAMQRARAGEVITLAPGRYRLDAGHVAADRPGTAQAGIAVRANVPDTVVIEVTGTEGFVVTAPHSTFENLTIRGVCVPQGDCEHAFHVVGNATHFVALNNTLVDFNAHIKVNGQDKQFPDDELVEGNTLVNTCARQTDNPVTSIDLVAASRWVIRANLIADFVKAGGDGVSYGAFAKGGGRDNRFERNLVVCEARLQGLSGARIGLSLGGGGTGDAYCRDLQCVTEQEAAVLDSNLVMGCSDDGIYVNRAAGSRIEYNTLIDAGGISVRFPQSSADLVANLVDGSIRSRDEGLIHERDNLQTGPTRLYLGLHPVRKLFRDTAAWDFAWLSAAPRAHAGLAAAPDLCGAARPGAATVGAFEDISACLSAGRSP